MTSSDSPDSRLQIPIVPGDAFVEPLSGKRMRGSSCRILSHPGQDDKVLPCAGGYQTYLDSNLLLAEENVVEALRELRDAITGSVLFSLSDTFSSQIGNEMSVICCESISFYAHVPRRASRSLIMGLIRSSI